MNPEENSGLRAGMFPFRYCSLSPCEYMLISLNLNNAESIDLHLQ